MPSITPSYVYTLFACMIVGTMLVCAFSASALNVKNEAEEQQIKKLATYVAAKGCELVSSAEENNLTAECSLNAPGFIGNRQYWIQMMNDSGVASVKTGFGTTPHATDYSVPMPVGVVASGTYTSGSGSLVLRCFIVGTTLYLQLSGGP